MNIQTSVLTGIGQLATQDSELGELTDAALVIEGGRIAWIGPEAHAPDADESVHFGGRAVVPGFVDSHAHLVFAGDRTDEFAARMSGTAYAAGGIQTTVEATRAASDNELRENLNVETEARSLRLAAEFTAETTFLGAHVVPLDAADPAAYIELVTGAMLDACVDDAKWIDVFCDRGAFDADAGRAILSAGIAAGLAPRVHANQLEQGPGVQLAVEMNAASADHCTHLSDADVDALANSDTVATLLPLAEFSTRSPYPDVRRLFAAGVSVALATDCNPGSAYSTSMPLAIALAVRDMHMTPAQALAAATRGGAQALRRDDVGVLAVGKRADFLVLDAPSYVHLAYRPGVPLISEVWRAGTQVHVAT
jgi:imidazolonepropionase